MDINDPSSASSKNLTTAIIMPPQPPLYGDKIRRFIKDEDKEDEAIYDITESMVFQFEREEERKRGVKAQLEEQRQKRAQGEGGVVKIEKNVKKEESGDGEDTIDDSMDEEKETKAEETKSSSAEVTPNYAVVDMILKAQKEDQPLLKQLAEYEIGYDKVYTLASSDTDAAAPTATEGDAPTAPSSSGLTDDAAPNENKIVSTTLPITATYDDHEVDDNGEFLDPLPPPPTTSTTNHATPSTPNGEKVGEVRKRKLEDVDDGGSPNRGKGKVLRRQSEEEDGGVKIGEETSPNRGKGKVLKKNVSKDEEATEMKEDSNEVKSEQDVSPNRGKGKTLKKKDDDDDAMETEKASEGADELTNDDAAKDAVAEELPQDVVKRNTKPFSLVPVPSFHAQDMRRVKLIQLEILTCGRSENIQADLARAQDEYNSSFKTSMALQSEKGKLMEQYKRTVEEQRNQIAVVRHKAQQHVMSAKSKWQRRQWELQQVRQQEGDAGLASRMAARDAAAALADRVAIREAPTNQCAGTRLIQAEFMDRNNLTEERATVLNVLGHTIDAVERRFLEEIADQPDFIPPPVSDENNIISNPATNETMAQGHQRMLNMMKKRVQEADSKFQDAEKVRGEAWSKVTTMKQYLSSAGMSSGKFRPRGKKTPAEVQEARERGNGVVIPRHLSSQPRSKAISSASAMPLPRVSDAGMHYLVSPNAPRAVPAFNVDGEVKTTSLSKYGYGDRYSQENVKARKLEDGAIIPVTKPKVNPDGSFVRPSGRQRKGMDWDAVRGVWVPIPGYVGDSSGRYSFED
eukprot:g10594.t1 g10594   contig4:2163763-2166428(-)